MAAGIYVDGYNEKMHQRHLAISTGLEKINWYNQELSAMLTISVLERNTLRSSSYQTVHEQLKQTVASIEALTRELVFAEEITALAEERRNLRQVELAVSELMEDAQWQRARALLFDEEYRLARKIYEINNETVIGVLNGELLKNAAAFRRVRLISLGMRFAALCLLLWAGLMFSIRLQQELKEQAKLKEELASANIHLEEKVRERTKELQNKNHRLQTALEENKILKGMLPICAKCKKIRDDKGYWNQLESYIGERSEAEFTHSLCPDCARELYPDFFKG